MININGIDYRGSVGDGPGLRIVIYFQGCLQHCEGCHNPSTWALDSGTSIDERCLIESIKAKTPIKRVTISGGEPLIQLEGLRVLLELLYEADYDVALYTGYEMEEVPEDILGYLKYIKTGRFIKEESTTIEYFGSRNQAFIHL